MSSLSRFVLVCLVLLGLGTIAQAGMTAYTERGKTDFDTVIQALNPYGTWAKAADGRWAYTPLDHQVPYTHGRWIYTEYGWYWKGAQPHSWVTEHYGFWKRGAEQVWSWYPGPFWLPEIVEIRSTATHIGWRSAAVDREGDFVERPEDRYTKTDEWTFVSIEQFANPITPEIVAKPDLAQKLLDDTTECRHTYVTYREIDRPGPHPADFLERCHDGGMFAPKPKDVQPPPSAIVPGITPGFPATPPATATNAPPQLASELRQVKYWVTMSLPTLWSSPPEDAKPEEIYLYRPDMFQDEDGIARRIELWLNPASRKSATQRLNEVLGGGGMPTVKTPGGTNDQPATPAVPATSATSAKAHDPFKSPFDDSFHPDPNHAPNPSSKGPSVPATNAPIPLPMENTNAAPVGR